MIMCEFPQPKSALKKRASKVKQTPAKGINGVRLLLLSARSIRSLQAMAREWAAVVTSTTPDQLDAMLYTALKRQTHRHRLAVAFADAKELSDHLSDWANSDDPAPKGNVYYNDYSNDAQLKPPQVAFICCGQGSQFAGMGRKMIEQDVRPFSTVMKTIDKRLKVEHNAKTMPRLILE